MATSDSVEDQAFVTLATTDAYAFGALVLGRSLRRVGTTRQLAVMVTTGVSQAIRQQLCETFDNITQVDVLDSRDTINLDLLTRPDLGVTFTKLHCWRLTQYSKAVFMDADTLVVQNIDDLFDREELSAAPDAGWPDCFNSGVFVYKPSLETYESLLQFAIQHGSFDGGDQGLLNLYFGEQWSSAITKHLPFLYNCVSQAFYSYLPAFKQFGKDIKVVHFIGAVKPWHYSYNTATRTVETTGETGHSLTFLQLWWNVFMADIVPKLDPEMRCMLHTYHKEPPPNPVVTGYTHDSSSQTGQPSSHHAQSNPVPDTSFVTGPYVVPDVKPFYEALNSGTNSEHQATEPVNVNTESAIKDDSRSYSHYEAFYPDPPMTTESDYVEPVNRTYEAKVFETMWADYGKTEESTIMGDSVDSSSKDILTGASTSSSAKKYGEGEVEIGGKFHDGKLLEAMLLLGEEGQLASLRIGGHRLQPSDYSKEQLDDVMRQYSWEKGQIDYLGIDAFSNIQKRLDEVLCTKPEEPEHPDPVQPPVLQPPTPSMPAKTTTTTPAAKKVKKPVPILKKS